MTHRRTRRDFLKAGLAAGVAPLFLRAADEKPSERIRLGFIGLGNQGAGINITNPDVKKAGANLAAFLGKKNAQVVALCDVDKTRLEQAKGFVATATGSTPVTFGDYR